ncbi:MAG: thiamine pyrophosphate-dependent enzyme [Sandaracinaceae bacterium]
MVLSADRPLALTRAGAPQTTDQTRLYGTHARFFADLGEPDPSEGALRDLVQTVRRAVEHALGPDAGPIQLNARADKPLEPIAANDDDERALERRARDAATDLSPATPTWPRVPEGALDAVREALLHAERPVLYAGPLPVDAPRDAILGFARRAGLTLMAEATSQLRFGPRDDVRVADAFDWWLGDGPTPDVVVEIGATPTSGRYLAWLDGTPRVRRFVLGGARFRDPSGTASAVILGELAELLAALDPGHAAPRDAAFTEADATAWARVDAALVDAPFGEAHVVRRLRDRLGADAWIALGNSLPIRHADRYLRGGGAPLRVLSQRGVNGIDGWIAGTAGAATATGAPTVAVIGDVTFAHDVGALQVAARVTTPLVLLVLDNGGGRIFEQLPIARAGIDMTLFTTPVTLDLGAAARAFGVAYAEASDAASLDAALDEALVRPGATVLRAVVPPHGAAALAQAIRGAR